jgi:hypothetical protein
MAGTLTTHLSMGDHAPDKEKVFLAKNIFD